MITAGLSHSTFAFGRRNFVLPLSVQFQCVLVALLAFEWKKVCRHENYHKIVPMCICECVLHMSNTQPIEPHYKFFTSSTYCAARCLVVVIASAIIYALTLRLTLSFFPTCTFAVAAVFFTLFIVPLLLLLFFSSFLSSIWIFTYRPHFYWFVVVVVAAVILFFSWRFGCWSFYLVSRFSLNSACR